MSFRPLRRSALAAALAAVPLTAAPSPWLALEEKIAPVPAATGPATAVLFDDSLPRGSYEYSYGSRTTAKPQGSGNRVLAVYAEDNDWSGWTLGLPKALDLSTLRGKAGIEFWVRGATGGERFHVGLIDDESDADKRKVQTRLPSADYVQVSREWRKVVLPLSDFSEEGRSWDAARNTEVVGTMDWSRIVELRISTDRDANKGKAVDGAARLYFDNVRIVPEAPASFDRAAYWKAFKGTAADDTLLSFERPGDRGAWRLDPGPGSTLDTAYVAESGRGTAAELRFRLGQWASFDLDLPRAKSTADWNRHRGLRMDIFSPRGPGVLRLMVIDSTNESWVTNVRLKAGWNDVRAPFAAFERNGVWQPEGSQPNRRLDLGAVRDLAIQPVQNAIGDFIRVDNVALTNDIAEESAKIETDRLRWNQLGFLPAGRKRFALADGRAGDFSLLDASGAVAFTGTLVPTGFWTAARESVQIGDFSAFNRPGVYRIAAAGKTSAPFAIADTVYREAFRGALKSFYYQRASTALPARFAGRWARAAGHPDSALTIIDAGREGTWSAPGGWYDAGDYGKYVVNAGVTVGTLLGLHELVPQAAPDGSLGIPESGNGRSDLLDEIRWELEWMARMQDVDGGVFFKVATLQWDGMIQPAEARSPRFAIGKSTTSALNLAGALAQAARVYRGVDRAFADSCLRRAERAWAWALANPAVREPANTGGSGGYGDSDPSDEFLWVASELWTSTRDAKYRAEVEKRLPALPMTPAASWARLHNLGWFSLSLGSDSLARVAQAGVVATAEDVLRMLEANPYRVPIEGFPWGSNGNLCNYAVTLAYAHRIKPDARYLDGLVAVLDYVYGRNAVGKSFVTGFGVDHARDPHHRPMVSDTVADPIPGFVVGGPNPSMQDDVSKTPSGVRYPRTEPALAWVDDSHSWASNETAINWNAPLVLALGYAQAALGPAQAAGATPASGKATAAKAAGADATAKPAKGKPSRNPTTP